MPYKTIADLPSGVKDNLPTHAAEIYMAAHNAAMKQYDNDEGKSAAVAWAAVEQSYKKNADGKWVAKEAKVKEILQAKYAEIIQEAAKRNKAEDTKVKAFISGCSVLLADETPQNANLQASGKEADEILVWLKEQASFKTEDGVKFPVVAYAYVPDPEKPSEWKLRLWEDLEKKVTRVQLGRAAAALSPGGFRGQKVEIPREDLSAVKRKIRAEYRKLDVADEDIPRWVKEVESRLLVDNYTSLKEAEVGTKGIAKVLVVAPGWGNPKDNNYYPAEMLARDYKVFEGMKMYADHQTEEEEKNRPEGSIRQWVASLKNVRFEEGVGVVGDAVIIEPWLQAKLALLRDKKLLNEMGISIRAAGIGVKGKMDGREGNIIERITRARSVDFVTEAGAGGAVTLYEAKSEYDIDIVSLESLRERRPDLVKIIETEAKAVITQEVKRKVELEEKVKELEANIETLTKGRDELKGKIAEAEKAKAKADAQAIIKEAVGKAELPDAAKTRLLERFKDAETADGIVEAIKAEADYIAALKESGKVKGMGGQQPNSEVAHKELVESFKRTGMSEKAAEIAATGR